MKTLWAAFLIAASFIVSSVAFSADYPAEQAAYIAVIHETETLHGLPSGLLLNLIRNESNFNPSVVSNKGAVGIAQIVPKWHPDVDPYDPHKSISYAGKYLKTLKTTFGSWSYAILAYNWGWGNMKKHGVNKAPRESLLLLSRTISPIF